MRDKTEVVCILDRSGSMENIPWSFTIGGYNSFLEQQKREPGEANLTVVMFDTEYEIRYSGDIRRASLMDKSTYVPRGGTALLDAMGRTIDEVGRRLASTPEHERANKIIVVIVTDGEENSSKEYNKDRIFNMITHQRTKYNWEFIFLAANQDAIAEATKYGIAPQLAINFVANAMGAQASYAVASSHISHYRHRGIVDQNLCNVDVDANGAIINRVVGSSTSGKPDGN